MLAVSPLRPISHHHPLGTKTHTGHTVILSLATFIVITIACPARSSTEINSKNVWSHFVNGSGGWPDGISFLTGLSTPQFMLSGLDATLHLAEECLEPERIVPKAVVVTVIVGFFTAFPFAIGIIYSFADVSASLDTPTGYALSLHCARQRKTTNASDRYPIYYIWEKATQSPAAATVFMAATFVVSCVALNAVHQTSSRLTWSFARDEALFFSRKLVSVSPSLGVPVYSVILDGVLVGLVGIVYVCSSTGECIPSYRRRRQPLTPDTAFNAFIGSTVMVAQISFAVPAALLLVRRRSSTFLPPTRPFKLPNVVGYVVNAMTIVWAIVITVFFCFPTSLPVTGGNMSMSNIDPPLCSSTNECRLDYAAVVLVVMLILGVINWFVYARKWYHGPRLEL